MEEGGVLRRSPRIVESRRPSPATSPPCSNGLLRSSRSAFPNSSDKRPSKKTRVSAESAKLRFIEEDIVLRRSPRSISSPKPSSATFSPCSNDTLRSSRSTFLGSAKLTLTEEDIALRRSPRIISSPKPSSATFSPCSNGRLISSQSTFPSSAKLPLTEECIVFRRSPRIISSLKHLAATSSPCSNGGLRSPQSTFPASAGKHPSEKPRVSTEHASPVLVKRKSKKSKTGCFFAGEPIPLDEARKRWSHRYEPKKNGSKTSKNDPSEDDDDEIVLDIKCHYALACIVGCIFELGDCASVKGKRGGSNYVGKILEFFETMDGQNYFTVKWFFRAEDTVIKDQSDFHDKRRLFASDVKNVNLLECIVSKVKVSQVIPNVDLRVKANSIPHCDFYYDMHYSLEYSTFCNIAADNVEDGSDIYSSVCNDCSLIEKFEIKSNPKAMSTDRKLEKSELTLLDLYSGCGGMSTGLCLGAKLSGVNLVTRWAVDFNKHACESLKLNHPDTEVRNESAEDFLALLKEWEKLCSRYAVNGAVKTKKSSSRISTADDAEGKNSNAKSGIASKEYEVSRLLGVCFGDPNKSGKHGLNFKVHWKGYGPSDDSWEPIENLRNCQDHVTDFVQEGFKSKILPLPGDVDVVCGGPPCQGISGFNRHRNAEAPLEDKKNHQLVVFMDIVKYLKPKYVLMENVVDILRFAGGLLGRYALSRLIHMNYQARLGIMAAGCYGLPQFRLRVFLWGAHPSEKLPQFPLPTHDVILRGGASTEFERNVVAYDEGQNRNLLEAILLGDAISDLPPVTNFEIRDQMQYNKAPKNEFQAYIRATKYEMLGSMSNGAKKAKKSILYDHRPLYLNEDDYQRVCQIPKRKGANFRDLPGVVVGAGNLVEWDPKMERVLLPSGKPLVPDYAMSFNSGRSTKPFGRLWWDETVATVVTSATPHSQIILHPEQDRVLTVRENARLQGFPDYYRFCGTVKERYKQIGNAVPVPVARALGYTLGMAFQKLSSNQPLVNFPSNFSRPPLQRRSSGSSDIEQ